MMPQACRFLKELVQMFYRAANKYGKQLLPGKHEEHAIVAAGVSMVAPAQTVVYFASRYNCWATSAYVQGMNCSFCNGGIKIARLR
jgi:hypothetical protein